jgi:rubrerythrin
MSLVKIFEYALAREREGRDFFLRHAERLSHAAAANAFRTLAAEEEKHIAYIEEVLSKLEAGGEASTPAFEGEGLFAERAEAELLEQSVIESMTPDVAVLRMAYLIERDFVEFYELAAHNADGAAKTALQNLAGWERGHEQLFRKLHDKVFEEYAQMPWGG